MLSVGSVFAGYRIERVLGAGGMGTVYLARSPELPRSDALKVLNADLSRDPGFRSRFVREADVACSLNHPHIVSVHRRGEYDGQLWIAMQFVDGTDADSALQAGTMTPIRAVHIVEQVAKALDYAHQRGVVHRDVKPANFLLSGPIGPDEWALLGDFGIARALGEVGLTVTGSVMVTLSYAAPEVLAGAPFDGRADLYSLGCTLFRLLTGQAPFAGAEGVAAVMAAHLHTPPPRVTDRVPGLSARMDAVIATAMAKDPAQRFPSARELAAAAAAAVADRASSTTAPWQPIRSTQVSAYPAAQQGSGPPWWQETGPVSTVMTPASWPTQYHPGFSPAGGPFPPPVRRRRRRRIIVALTAVALAAVATSTTVVLTTKPHTHNAAQNTSRAPTPSSPSTPTPPAPPVPVSALSGFLLSAEQASEIMGATSMVSPISSDALIDDSMKIVEKDCVGAWAPAQHDVYGNSGYTAARVQLLRNPSDVAAIFQVIQSVIAFPTAEAAQKLVAAQKTQWSACTGRPFTLQYANEPAPEHWTFGPLNDTGGTLSMKQVPPGADGCQRALTARNNVAIDVIACRFDVSNQGVDVLNAIAAKVHPA